MSRRPKDPEAFERKVRPIYDALDSRNWKGALKLCQQALQKYPDNDLVRVLKAIGLDRSGKREEANQLVDEVAAGTPVDEQVLRLAAMVLRASGRLAEITRLYEAAAAAAAAMPGAADLALVLLHETFGAHIRESNFVKQQQVALRLSKAVAVAGAGAGAAAAAAAAAAGGGGGASAEQYGWWVVLSLLLQARAALRARATGVPAPAGQVPPVSMDPEKQLALAEGMIARQAGKDGRLEGYEAFMVYVDVLIAQGKVSTALQLVAGPMGAAAIRLPSERLQLRAVLSALCGDLEGAAAALREGLQLNPDDWGALLLLLDCMLPGTAAGQGSPGSAAAATFTPRHPLVLISGGLAEQLPPKGVPVPPDGGATADAFNQAEAILQELVTLGSASIGDTQEGSRSSSNNGNNGNGDGSNGAGSNGTGSGVGKAMTMRGPDLALVDLAMRRHRAAPNNDSEAAVADAVLSYYRKYGSLVSCAVDLRGYVSQLGAAAADRLAAAVQQEADAAAAAAAAAAGAGAGGADTRVSLSLLRRRVCAAQIRDDLGLPRLGTCEEGVALAREMLELYGTARPLQEGLDERERGAADELPVLAASALATSAALAPSEAAAVPYMLAAYGALADAVRQRPYGAGMRISLSALAALLAAPAAAAGHLLKLDIKHMQLDTLGGHLLLPALLAWTVPGGGGEACAASDAGASSSASSASSSSHGGPGSGSGSASSPQALLERALRDTRALFEDHGRDAGETLFTAYNHGMYTKVLEFTAFRERLAAAHTLAVVRAESALAACLGPHSSSTSSQQPQQQQQQQQQLSGAAAGGHGEGTGEAARVAAAAAAAAEGLKAAEMPTEASLRFNWDLSTRPTWLPPCASSPSMHVLEWWRSRARGVGEMRGQGYGRCWWSATSSAEGPSPAAARWRTAQASAACHRWLLPHCIAGALGGAAERQVLPLSEAVSRMEAALLDHDSSSAAAAASTAASGQASSPAVDKAPSSTATATATETETATETLPPCSTQLRRLDVLLYGAALAVQIALAPSTSSSSSSSSSAAPVGASEADTACSALAALAAAVRSAAGSAASCLAACCPAAAGWGGVVPGGALAAVAHLVREPLAVLALCLQAWQASLKSLRKRRTKAGTQLEQPAQRLADAVAAAAEALAEAARGCGEALAEAAATGPEDGAAVAAVAVEYLKAQGHAPACVSEAAAAALRSLAEEQRRTVRALARQAAALVA